MVFQFFLKKREKKKKGLISLIYQRSQYFNVEVLCGTCNFIGQPLQYTQNFYIYSYWASEDLCLKALKWIITDINGVRGNYPNFLAF